MIEFNPVCRKHFEEASYLLSGEQRGRLYDALITYLYTGINPQFLFSKNENEAELRRLFYKMKGYINGKLNGDTNVNIKY